MVVIAIQPYGAVLLTDDPVDFECDALGRCRHDGLFRGDAESPVAADELTEFGDDVLGVGMMAVWGLLVRVVRLGRFLGGGLLFLMGLVPGELGVRQLVADGHPLSRPDQFGKVGVQGVVGEPRHLQCFPVRSFPAVAPCQCYPEDGGCLLRILQVSFVEVTDTEEQQCVGMLCLEVEVLLEYGRELFLLARLLRFGGELSVCLLSLSSRFLKPLDLCLCFRGGGETVKMKGCP